MISIWEIRLIFFKECPLDMPERKIEKTSIRYAREKNREKREWERQREQKINQYIPLREVKQAN